MQSNLATIQAKSPVSAKLGYFSVILVLGLVIFLQSLIALVQVPGSNIYFAEVTSLSIASLMLFLIICFLGIYSKQLYFTFLIFVLLAFPAPVNDFFPGTYLGKMNEFGTAIFPFFTHIDIYLIIGIIRAVLLQHKIRPWRPMLFFTVFVCLFLSVSANYFYSRNYLESLLLVQGLFQFRYLIEIYFFLSLYNVSEFKENIIKGFVLSILFLFLESIVYTAKTGSTVLMSGSLANNVFASCVAAILLFLLYVRRRFKHPFLLGFSVSLSLLVAIIIIFATGARMAILAFFVIYFTVSFIESSRKKKILKKLLWILTLVGFVWALIAFSERLPKRYNFHTVTDKIAIKNFSWDLTKFVNIERSWETNSLISRLELYTTSINMFKGNTFFGIGVGRWNLLKNEYGFKEKLLIDSHNGYLSTLSQYGLMGIPLIYFIYIFPVAIFILKHRKRNKYNYLYYLVFINMFFAFSDFSNSALFKHQVFALLAFNSICLLQLNNLESNEVIKGNEPINLAA